MSGFSRLTLTVTGSRGGAVNSLVHIFRAEGGTIGRGKENSWVLPDPEKVISRRHAKVIFQDGEYYLEDTSTNGVFINSPEALVGKENRVRLNDGDQLYVGDYIIRVSLSGDVPSAESPPGSDSFDNVFVDAQDTGMFDPLRALDEGEPPTSVPQGPEKLPAEDTFEPATEVLATQPDHAPALEEDFEQPSVQEAIPGDWDQRIGFEDLDEELPDESLSSELEPMPAPAMPAPAASIRAGRAEAPGKLPESEIQFTAFIPRAVSPNLWYSVLVYAHIPEALLSIELDSRTRSGAMDTGKSTTHPTQTVQRGTELMVVPTWPGFQINPERASFRWLEDWHSVEFRVRADGQNTASKVGTAINGSIAFYVGMVLVAEVKTCTILSNEPVSAQGFPEHRETAALYQRVFVSYAHNDAEIVDSLEWAYNVLGIEYLRDVRVLRSGQKWKKIILSKILEADIFQLCWSEYAKESPFVEQEWRHALTHQRPGFLRPCFWQEPMPKPPEELRAYHFAYLPWVTM